MNNCASPDGYKYCIVGEECSDYEGCSLIQLDYLDTIKKLNDFISGNDYGKFNYCPFCGKAVDDLLLDALDERIKADSNPG